MKIRIKSSITPRILERSSPLILLVAGISIASPSFRTGANFLSLLRQSSINGLIAFGMTFVILTDAIDLSVGSVLVPSARLCAPE